jgi:Domain of unknown function (DUF4174)
MKYIFILILSSMSFILSAQKSDYRRILIFAPDSSNLSFKNQNRIFEKEDSACVERNIIIETYIFKTSGIRFFDKYQVSTRDFTLLLIGKDGFVKLRSKEVVPASKIYALVDVMPMRKDEIRKIKKN